MNAEKRKSGRPRAKNPLNRKLIVKVTDDDLVGIDLLGGNRSQRFRDMLPPAELVEMFLRIQAGDPSLTWRHVVLSGIIERLQNLTFKDDDPPVQKNQPRAASPFYGMTKKQKLAEIDKIPQDLTPADCPLSGAELERQHSGTQAAADNDTVTIKKSDFDKLERLIESQSNSLLQIQADHKKSADAQEKNREAYLELAADFRILCSYVKLSDTALQREREQLQKGFE